MQDFEKYVKSTGVNLHYYEHHKKMLNFNSPVFSIENSNVFSKLFSQRILVLTGEVDDYNCELLKAQLLYLESESDEDITLQINSGGGSVYAGLGLLDTMEYVKPDIITINTGLAASMAAVLLCSGTQGKRKSLKRSRTMIHQPMAGFRGFLQASDIEIDAKQMNSIKKELLQIISDRTGQDYDKVQKDSDRDYWMNSDEALNYGMIDEIIGKKSGK
jgi:ATP-dependent Clp protease protease subunit